MCLYTKAAEPQIASEDIFCYKVLAVTADGRFFTPFLVRKVSVPGKITAAFSATKGLYVRSLGRYEVSGEGVHAIIDKREAIIERLRMIESGLFFAELVIVRCTIPKGTGFWIGDDCDIAAKQMILEEVES